MFIIIIKKNIISQTTEIITSESSENTIDTTNIEPITTDTEDGTDSNAISLFKIKNKIMFAVVAVGFIFELWL